MGLDDKIQHDIEHYVSKFRSGLKKFDQEEINKILTSDDYFKFINTVYDYFNEQIPSKNNGGERLSIECYIDAEQAINDFWLELLGKNANDSLKSYLKIGT